MSPVRRSGTAYFLDAHDKLVLTRIRLSLRSRRTMLRNLNDVLGKNILRDVFQFRGSAETEAEVPPSNAKRIDLWFVPEAAKLATDSLELGDLLDRMTMDTAAVEVWSLAIGVNDFFRSLSKREVWREYQQLRDKRDKRDKRVCRRPMLWHLCAGKPVTVLKEFGFEPTTMPGWYRCREPIWRIQIVVIGELPVTRSTLLLRLLGRGRVRRQAMSELLALPDDAWEKQLAHPWLLRVGLEVPMSRSMEAEDRELVMDIRAWYEEHNRKLRNTWREEFMREIEEQRAEERRQLAAQRAEERRQAEVNQIVRQFEHRLGRTLSSDERGCLTNHVKTHGSEQLADLVLDLSRPDLAAWLENQLADTRR